MPLGKVPNTISSNGDETLGSHWTPEQEADRDYRRALQLKDDATRMYQEESLAEFKSLWLRRITACERIARFCLDLRRKLAEEA